MHLTEKTAERLIQNLCATEEIIIAAKFWEYSLYKSEGEYLFQKQWCDKI